MGRSTFYIVSDDFETIQRAKSYCESQGWVYEVYSSADWDRKLDGTSPLATGTAPVEQGAKILPFPGNNMSPVEKRVQTINQLESVAIESAIHEYGGNLTEAAKALGIGRATLYRKVKQYNIDPSLARKKRVA